MPRTRPFVGDSILEHDRIGVAIYGSFAPFFYLADILRCLYCGAMYRSPFALIRGNLLVQYYSSD